MDNHRRRLRNFKLVETHCSDSKDREILQSDIKARFGEIENFEKYVKTEVMDEIVSLAPRLEFMWFAGLPQLSSVLGYICVLTQRIGLYCMSSLDAGYVPRDDLFCRILDRDRVQNGIVIVTQIIRYVCFYPVIIATLMKACDFVYTRYAESVKRFIGFFAVFTVLSAYMILENWKFPEKYTGLVNGLHGAKFLILFALIYIRPLFKK